MVQILCTHGIVTTFTLFHTYISPPAPSSLCAGSPKTTDPG
jgi:hypothetical protein